MMLHGTTSTTFESEQQKNPSTHDFFSSFDFIFDLNALSGKEKIDVLASLAFNYENVRTNPDWSLQLSSVRNEITDATIKTFEFLQDIFNNYDSSVEHFTISFHKPGVSGINPHTTLKYKSDEIEGTFIDVDRRDPQSVIDAIASITYYMQKHNAFVIVKEGLRSQQLHTLVMCFDQRKIYEPDIIQSLSLTSTSANRIANKFLSSYSKTHYVNWINQYNGIFNTGNIFPLYLFHDVNEGNKLAQLIVDSLSIYLGVGSQILELQKPW